MAPSQPSGVVTRHVRVSEPQGANDAAPLAGAHPRRVLGGGAAAAVVIGMVVGAGVFRTASAAAQTLGSQAAVMAVWTLGGVFAVAGALCYGELATAFPSPGGDYRFLKAAFGPTVAFLFAWSRFAIVFTASSAMLAFVGADYLAQLAPLANIDRAAVAAALILLLALLNARGVRVGATGQMVFVALDVGALLTVAAAGAWLAHLGAPPAMTARSSPTMSLGGAGSALVFVMLAYGGFSDAATLSAEVRSPRDITRAMVGGMAAVTALYLMANAAYLRGLGLAGLANSDAPAAAVVMRAFGPAAQAAMVAVVALTALSSLNALVLVGCRTLFAAAADLPSLRILAGWDERRGVPSAALWLQTAVSLALVGWGAWTRRGFAAMVDYMAPVYWLFLSLAPVALLVLRRTRPEVPRPYRTPAGWLIGGGFLAGSLFVLVASLAYVRLAGAALSLGVLLAGLGVRRALLRAGALEELRAGG